MTRRERIIALLGSYLDVADPLVRISDQHPGGKPGSRDLRRHGLWAHGSYGDLERGLERMLQKGYRSIHWHTIELYVRHDPTGKARRRKANAGLELLTRWLPKDIYVPQEVAEHAGYLGAKTDRFPQRAA